MIIVYSQNDQTNKLAVVSSVESELQKTVLERVVPKGRPYAILDSLNLDNYFFDAYEFKDDKIILNVSKAKEIHLNNFRKVRTSLLTDLDAQFLRALEYGGVEKQKEISVKKMVLRDITKTELPENPEEIKKVWPKVLGSNPFLI